MTAENELEIVPERTVEVRETRKLFRLHRLRTTTSAGPAGRSLSSLWIRRTRRERPRPSTTYSDAIGGIRFSPLAITWKHRRPTFSAP
jgi:hypothetical protein